MDDKLQHDNKKTWVRPLVEEVSIEPDEDVLRVCYNLTYSTVRRGGGCGLGKSCSNAL